MRSCFFWEKICRSRETKFFGLNVISQKTGAAWKSSQYVGVLATSAQNLSTSNIDLELKGLLFGPFDRRQEPNTMAMDTQYLMQGAAEAGVDTLEPVSSWGSTMTSGAMAFFSGSPCEKDKVPLYFREAMGLSDPGNLKMGRRIWVFHSGIYYVTIAGEGTNMIRSDKKSRSGEFLVNNPDFSSFDRSPRSHLPPSARFHSLDRTRRHLSVRRTSPPRVLVEIDGIDQIPRYHHGRQGRDLAERSHVPQAEQIFRGTGMCV